MTLILSLLLACGTPEPHSHAEGGHDHDHAKTEHDHEHPPAKAAAASGPVEAPLGTHTARLTAAADGLTLEVVDADGHPIAAEGEAKVVLTGTGEDAQKLVLTADGNAWKGAGKAEGAPGYIAVATVTLDGHTESARLTWGDVPDAAPAPDKHEHDHGEGGHGHDHGEGGHTH